MVFFFFFLRAWTTGSGGGALDVLQRADFCRKNFWTVYEENKKSFFLKDQAEALDESKGKVKKAEDSITREC